MITLGQLIYMVNLEGIRNGNQFTGRLILWPSTTLA